MLACPPIGYLGVTSGLYWDNGKENGSYHIIGVSASSREFSHGVWICGYDEARLSQPLREFSV